MPLINPQLTFIASIKEKIRLAQYEALKEVNTQLIRLYWDIGKDISERQGENWGKSAHRNPSRHRCGNRKGTSLGCGEQETYHIIRRKNQSGCGKGVGGINIDLGFD